MKKVDKKEVINYVKLNEPCLITDLHRFIRTTYNIRTSQSSSRVIRNLIELNLLKRNIVYPSIFIDVVTHPLK